MLKFENATNGRFYYLYVDKDMLNDMVLRVIYGGRNISRTRTLLEGNRLAIQKELDRLSKRRIKRGYTLV